MTLAEFIAHLMKGTRDRELYDKITRCSFERLKDVSAEAQNLISGILKLNPKERLTTAQVASRTIFLSFKALT